MDFRVCLFNVFDLDTKFHLFTLIITYGGGTWIRSHRTNPSYHDRKVVSIRNESVCLGNGQQSAACIPTVMRYQTSNNPGQDMVGQASCLPFVTPDSDPGSSLDARVRGHDDRQDACPTRNTVSLARRRNVKQDSRASHCVRCNRSNYERGNRSLRRAQRPRRILFSPTPMRIVDPAGSGYVIPLCAGRTMPT